ncbi:hypothetical protein ABTX35_03520 [Streptomyces sp. NPDC096080]|uniref:hypothetical protein n=1 Tax=Streptomyces sp. NPDC096080 TaxID=3156693 RepID=UPI0033232E54
MTHTPGTEETSGGETTPTGPESPVQLTPRSAGTSAAPDDTFVAPPPPPPSRPFPSDWDNFDENDGHHQEDREDAPPSSQPARHEPTGTEELRTPAGPPLAAKAPSAQAATDTPRLRIRDVLPFPKPASKPPEPECTHERTVPVHAQPYGELVAYLCVICDEQLEPESPDAAGTPAQEPDVRPGAVAPTGKAPASSKSSVSTNYMRPILFTGTAAAVGYSIGAVDVLGECLYTADHGAVGIAGAILALGCGYGAWRLSGTHVVASILPGGLVGRAVVTAMGASYAPGIAHELVGFLGQYGHYAGLDPSGVALLVASTGMCGGLYWAIDRRFRNQGWFLRWLARIPLASALLAVVLYAPGPR